MSRTYRQPIHWASDQLRGILEDIAKAGVTKPIAARWAREATARLRGDDGTATTYIGDPMGDAPKGYGYYGARGDLGKRYSKKRTAHIMRRRGSKEVKVRLHEHYNSTYEDQLIWLDEERRDQEWELTEHMREEENWSDYCDEDYFDELPFHDEIDYDYDFDYSTEARQRRVTEREARAAINDLVVRHGLNFVINQAHRADNEQSAIMALDDILQRFG